MRFREVGLEFDRPPHVIDRFGQQCRIGAVTRARHLVLPEMRIAQADVGGRIPRVDADRPLEIIDRAGDLRTIESVEPDAPLGERMVSIQAAGLTQRPPRRRIIAAADRGGELRDDAIAMAYRLIAAGVQPEDRIALVAETGPEFAALFFGAVYAGAWLTAAG